MDAATTTYKVHQCSNCLGDTEYFCQSCLCDLCSQCSENHETDLKTIDHNVVFYREDFTYIPKQYCTSHSNRVCFGQKKNISQRKLEKYCERCKVPVCFYCKEHRTHRHLNIITTYETKRQQHAETIYTIKSWDLVYRRVLQTQMKADIKTCLTKFSFYQSEMLRKAKRLTNCLNNVLRGVDFRHSCLKQMRKMNRHLAIILIYEHGHEQSAIRPIQFLRNKSRLPQIQDTPHLTLHTNQLSMTLSFKKEAVIESLSGIQITERRNRRVGKDCLLKLMSSPELYQSLTVLGVDRCYHISCETSQCVWVSENKKNLYLTYIDGDTLHHLNDFKSGLYGFHTVNNEGDLIYIDRNYNINKLSYDLKTTTTVLVSKGNERKPWCVYCSPDTGDLLIGMDKMVTKYNQAGQLTLKIPHANEQKELFSKPRYITENNNGDIVVSDYNSLSGSVVVTERGGRHRFSYTGHPTGSGLQPGGICTDALSHILVCDVLTQTVQMLDKGGQFLSHLLIRPPGIVSPLSLSYDDHTHRLFVGSQYNNRVNVYRYMSRKIALADQDIITADTTSSSNEFRITKTKSRQPHDYLFKMKFPPKLNHCFNMEHVCYHISYVKPECVWASDTNTNFMLINTTGDILNRLMDFKRGLYGFHTVNSEDELIYIDRNYNIKKLSKNMKTTTIFIDRQVLRWKPWCVHYSLSTRDLLVGMYKTNPETAKVTRYNQNGQQTQTYQSDSSGLELYKYPNYITENTNGDVVVSDFDYTSGAVVVTERGGRHRFSYTGHPPGSGLLPYGICTDALSHILVCEGKTNSVQMLDMDGHFLSHLLTKSQYMDRPLGLSYVINTDRLWVGSAVDHMMSVYSSITRQDDVIDKPTHGTDGDAVSSPNSALQLKQ